MPMKLNDQTLASLPAKVAKPNYRRDQLSAGIVHIGVGNFHRLHLRRQDGDDFRGAHGQRHIAEGKHGMAEGGDVVAVDA